MSEMGMSNWDILAATSTAAADFLELDYGVSEGSLANLVILQADPTQNIAHTQKISAVIQHAAGARGSLARICVLASKC